MDEVTASHVKNYSKKVPTEFCSSGLLRKAIAEGGTPDVFAFADIDRPKALQLTGGPVSIKAPEGRSQYGWVMAEKKAAIFLTHCTNAVLAQKELQSLKIFLWELLTAF